MISTPVGAATGLEADNYKEVGVHVELSQDAKIITQDTILTRVESRLRSVGLKPVVEPGIAALGVQITASELKSGVWLA